MSWARCRTADALDVHGFIIPGHPAPDSSLPAILLLYEPFTVSESGARIEIDEWSAADDLYATVPGYAKLLAAILAERDPGLMSLRTTVLSSSDDESGYACILPKVAVPIPWVTHLIGRYSGSPAGRSSTIAAMILANTPRSISFRKPAKALFCS